MTKEKYIIDFGPLVTNLIMERKTDSGIYQSQQVKYYPQQVKYDFEIEEETEYEKKWKNYTNNDQNENHSVAIKNYAAEA